MKADLLDDPQAFVEELGQVGKFVPDETGQIQYYKPSERELKELNTHYQQEIEQAERDHAGRYARLRQNERAYDAIPEPNADGATPAIVLPIVRRDVDQTSAWFVNQIVGAHPIVSIDACYDAEYEIPVETGDPNFPTAMLKTPAEKAAAHLEHSIEYINRERLKFRDLADTLITEVVKGRGPGIAKVVFDQKFYRQYISDIKAGVFGSALFAEPKVVTKEEGMPVKYYAIPTENFIMAADEERPMTARWVAERTPMTTPDLRRELKNEFSLIKQAEWDAMLAQQGDGADDIVDQTRKEMKALVDGRVALTPRNRHDVREVWFEYFVEGEESDEPTQLMGLFHLRAGRFLWIIKNPYHHQRKPYVAFFQKKRPFRFSGSSTGEELQPIQNLITEIFHATLTNAWVANSTPVVADPNSEAFDWLQENPVEAASLIPGRPDEVKSLDFGRAYRTMMPELGFLLDLGRSVGRNTQYTDGSYIPGRTSPNTVDMIMKSGQQVSLSQLQSFGDSFCEMIWLWLKTYKQYKPMGEVFYSQNPEDKAIQEIPFRLPDEAALDNFKITLTAADEMAAKESSIEYLTSIGNILREDADQVAKILGPLAQIDVPDSFVPILTLLITRQQENLGEIMRLTRSDPKSFIVSAEMLRSVDEERKLVRQQLEMQQQMAAAAAAQGGQVNGTQPQPSQVEGAAGQAGQ